MLASTLSSAVNFAVEKNRFLFAQLYRVNQENCWCVQNLVTYMRGAFRMEIYCSLRCLSPSGRMALTSIV